MEKLKQILGSFLLFSLLALFAMPVFLFAEDEDREFLLDANTSVRPKDSLAPTNTNQNQPVPNDYTRIFLNPMRAEIQSRIETQQTLVEEREEALTSRREEMRIMTERRAEILTQAQERREEVSNRLSDEAERRVQNTTQVVFERFNNAIRRMQNIASRIEARIERLENRGYDMSLARESLDLSAETLVVLESDLLEARSATDLMVQSENPLEFFLAIRSLVREMRTSLESTRQSFLETLRIIRASVEADI